MVEQPVYLAYMLRMWRVEAEDGPAWRASLESPHTGERRGFASLEALVAYLRQEFGAGKARVAPAWTGSLV